MTTTKRNYGWEKAGFAAGSSQKEAIARFKALKPQACKGRVLKAEKNYESRGGKIVPVGYSIWWSTINRWGKHIMHR